jgi:hypothetical protein
MKHLFVRLFTLGLLTVSLVAAGTYKFQLSEQVKVGQTQLQPGKYSMNVEGTTAVLKDKDGKTIEVKAKVVEMPNKAVVTVVGLSPDSGVKQLKSIIFGGSRIRVEFE